MTPEQIIYVKNYIRDDCRVSLWGRLLYALGWYRKKIVLDNIGIVFGNNLSMQEKKKLAQAFYTHILKMIVEVVAFGFMSSKRIRERLTVIGMENITPFLNANKPMLFLTGHFGNWEVCLNSWPLKFPILKNKLSIIRKKITPRSLENILYQQCRKNGLQVLSNDQGLKKIITGFKQGISFLFVFDQYAHPTEGILVDFFGKPTGTYKIAAQLALRYHLPIIPGGMYRDKKKRHVIKLHAPLTWVSASTPEEEIRLNTQAFNHVLENIILEHPEQWIWSHRRWKHHEGYYAKK